MPRCVALTIVFADVDFSVMRACAFIGARALRLPKASATRWFDRMCRGGALLALAGSLAYSLAFDRPANT